jgi:hypothetical protein
MKHLVFTFLFFNLYYSFGQKPSLYIVLEQPIENEEQLKTELKALNLKKKTQKKYLVKFYYLGDKKIQPETFNYLEYKSYLLEDLCSVCDSIFSWKINEEFAFQIKNAENTCQAFIGKVDKDIASIDKRLNESKFKESVLIYKPEDRNLVKLSNIPSVLDKSSFVNFSISSNSNNDIDVKLGIQVLDDGIWNFLPQEDVKLSNDQWLNKTFDLSEDSKICIDYEKINGCRAIECSDIIKYKYINKVKPIEIYLDDQFDNFPTNILKNFPDEKFNCGAQYEIMPESDDYYYFIIKKQKGIKSIKLKLNDICDSPVLNECQEIILELIEDINFNKQYSSYSRYKINKNYFDPGEVDKLTCADFWNYFYNINNQPLREFEATFIPQIDQNSEFVGKERETKLKLIFRTCGFH